MTELLYLRDSYLREADATATAVVPRLRAVALDRTVNLIPESASEIRVVDIVGPHKQADGGTHVACTDEVGAIRVVKTEPKGKGNKRIRLEVVDSVRADVESLRERLRAIGSVVVAYSGGVDSALVAHQAAAVLGRRAHAVTAVSASLAAGEADECRRTADAWGLRWSAVETDELDRPEYRANGADRCWHCKSSLMDQLVPIAEAEAATVVLGVNLDDLGEHRPGQQAAADRGAVFPLVDAGFTKADVRRVAHQLGLSVWDKPAAACLASRVPYGTPVILRTLDRVGAAESGLRRLGFAQLRVRHYGDVARVELLPDDLPRAVAIAGQVIDTVKAAGYRYVTLDLEGFRSGNLNQALAGGD